jgi:hypothetical protein
MFNAFFCAMNMGIRLLACSAEVIAGSVRVGAGGLERRRC